MACTRAEELPQAPGPGPRPWLTGVHVARRMLGNFTVGNLAGDLILGSMILTTHTQLVETLYVAIGLAARGSTPGKLGPFRPAPARRLGWRGLLRPAA